VTRLSSIYETEPVGEVGQTPFLNMVAEVGNNRPPPNRCWRGCCEIEWLLGAYREVKGGPRTIDLDLFALRRSGEQDWISAAAASANATRAGLCWSLWMENRTAPDAPPL